MTIEQKVGKAIIKIRKQKGFSQENFAYEAGIGRRYMSDIENGKRQVSVNVVYRVCQKLGLSLSEFFKVVEESQ